MLRKTASTAVAAAVCHPSATSQVALSQGSCYGVIVNSFYFSSTNITFDTTTLGYWHHCH